jgi:hypothetical protein
MNPGDKITVHMFDATRSGGGHAFEAVVRDAATGKTGFMPAPGGECFHKRQREHLRRHAVQLQPEDSTASAGNIVPWAALQVNISTEFETGHFEPCSTVTSTAWPTWQSVVAMLGRRTRHRQFAAHCGPTVTPAGPFWPDTSVVTPVPFRLASLTVPLPWLVQ